MSLSTVTFKRLSGAAIVPFVRDLARLRIDIFREYPYLYDGDEDYELNYLKTYVQSPRSIVMLVFDGNRLVGATTGLPMADETTEFQRPFLDRDLDVRGIFYCGESVLRPSCRGRGIYRQLFRAREDHARTLGGFHTATFCCVQRPVSHPARPADYVPLDAVWQHFGYAEHPELQTEYVWKDIDEAQATSKQMRFWTKTLT